MLRREIVKIQTHKVAFEFVILAEIIESQKNSPTCLITYSTKVVCYNNTSKTYFPPSVHLTTANLMTALTFSGILDSCRLFMVYLFGYACNLLECLQNLFLLSSD